MLGVEALAASEQAEVQIVLRQFPSVAAVLHSFDVEPCALAFDGRTVLATPRALAALTSGVIVVFRALSDSV